RRLSERVGQQEGRTGLEAIARHRHAAIVRGGNDCRHDAGDWLAAALGAWLPGRRGAQAPQAQAWIEEGGWDPGVPGCNRRQRQAQHSPLQAPVVLSAPCRASGSVLPCRTANHSTPRLRACAISASVSFAPVGTPCSGGSRPLTYPAICCFASWPTGCRPISWVTWTSRPYACSIARGPEKAGQRAVSVGQRTAELRPGTMLGREWNGQMHRVAVLTEGFAWNGKTYRSLTKVAFAITGTRWSGPKFFGFARRNGTRTRNNNKKSVCPTDQ